MKSRYLLRVISGKYKGKGIISPKDNTVRPTSQRVKDSLFNIIRIDLYGKTFIDIFSGTGQIGIEAISNGADVTFVDADTTLIKSNVMNIGCSEKTEIICGDFKNILDSFCKTNRKFDFIFADPPYKEGFYTDIIKFSVPLLNDNGVLILEHSSDFEIAVPSACNIIDKRVYGSRSLTFIGGKNENNGVSG